MAGFLFSRLLPILGKGLSMAGGFSGILNGASSLLSNIFPRHTDKINKVADYGRTAYKAYKTYKAVRKDPRGAMDRFLSNESQRGMGEVGPRRRGADQLMTGKDERSSRLRNLVQSEV